MSDLPSGNRFVGQRVVRREDPRLLTGHGTFVDDVEVPGMLHAAFVRSIDARGVVRGVDVAAAQALEGVVAVLTADDLNDMVHECWNDLRGPPLDETTYPPFRALAGDDVRFVGEPVAVVVAGSRYIAEDAADLVEVDIDPSEPVLDPLAALAEGSELVHPEFGSNLAGAMSLGDGDEVDAIFESAAHVVTETFRQHRYACVPMETRGIVTSWDPFAEELMVWLSTQGVHGARSYISRATGLPEHQVRVVARDVGGGFGQKMFVMREELVAVLASIFLGRPVKWIEDRRENLIAGNHSRDEQMTISCALDPDGRMLALRADHRENVGAFPYPGNGSNAGLTAVMLPGPYRIPKVHYRSTAVYTNTCGRCAYRGPWMMETVAREQLVDSIARELGIDPLELRRRNVVRSIDLPYTTATGLVYDGTSIEETLEQAAAMVDYQSLRGHLDPARSEGRVGVGLSLYVEPTGIASGALASEAASVRVTTNGRVEVSVGATSHGHSLETTIVQVVADELGVEMDDVTLVQGDTASTPYGAGTGGSRSAVLYGGAAQQASAELREKATAIAAHMLEASPADIDSAKGRFFVRGTPSLSVSLAELARAAWIQQDRLPPGAGPGLESFARFAPSSRFTFSNSCHVCICEIDPVTGEIELLRYVVSEDCGTMVNPMVVEGQIAGGVAQGIGGVLYEHMIYDDAGNPLTSTLLDYLLPTAAEVPDLEYGHIETPAATNPGGHKGLGEGGAIGSPPAVINAVADAVGRTLNEQPLTPDVVVEAIRHGAQR